MSIKNDVVNELKTVPKTEIHLHIEAVITAKSVWALMHKYKISIDGVTTIKDLEKKFKVKSLTEFIDLFIHVIQGSFKEAEDFNFLMDDLKSYLIENNIVYSEVYLAPTSFLKNGFEFKSIIDILQKRADVIVAENGIEIKYIIDVSRGFGLENAMKNLDLALKYRTNRIIGIGLGGAEKVGKAEIFEPVFKKAVKAGLHVVAHAGEDADFTSINAAVDILKVERIGHGISAMENEDCMAHLKDLQIPLEICPTSNLFTGAYVKTIEEHPVRMFFDKGLFVTINSDDPTIFGSALLEEYGLLVAHNIFNKKEIGLLVLNSIKATFMEQKAKESLELKARESLNNIGYL